jgi:hypothetical protein
MVYIPGRIFNALLCSIRDSAVCYYLDVRPLERWQSRQFTVLLAAEDQYGFGIKKNTGGAVYETGAAQGKCFDPSERPSGGGAQETPVTMINPVLPGQSIPGPAPAQQPTTNIVPQLSNTAQAIIPAAPNPYPAPTGTQERTQAPRGSINLPIGSIRLDLMTLRELMYKVDEYIYFGTPITEEELRGMEMTIGKLRSRYGGIFSPY